MRKLFIKLFEIIFRYRKSNGFENCSNCLSYSKIYKLCGFFERNVNSNFVCKKYRKIK